MSGTNRMAGKKNIIVLRTLNHFLVFGMKSQKWHIDERRTCYCLIKPQQRNQIPAKQWQQVGADSFHFKNNDYLIVVDYFFNFPEIALLKSTTCSSIIAHIKSIFARRGIPEKVTSDNGPQFVSK